ncbi:MAG: collagen binding domain-containing protein [Bacilli bacterium]
MKKFLKFIIIAALLFPGKSVSSESKISGENINYNKNSVNIVENRNILYYSTFSNIGVYWQDLYVNGKYSYCLNFEDLIENGSNHYLEDPQKYYSDNHWNMISLYAMYAQRAFERTGDKNYQLAGQALIHESFEDKPTEMKFYDVSSGLRKEFNVDSYKKEIIDLYNTHLTIPNLNFGDTSFKVGDIYSFEDQNYIIKNYDIEDVNGNSEISIEENSLKIKVKGSGKTTFTLTSDKYSKDGEIMLWVASNMQDLITVTSYNPTKIDYDFVSTVKTGSLEVFKVDSTTKEKLNGAEFTLKKYTDGNIIDISDFTVNEYITLSDLEIGKYQLVETKAPIGYIKKNNSIEFEIKNDGEVVVLEIENDKILPQTGINSNLFYYTFYIIIFLILIRVKRDIKLSFKR